MLKRIFSVVLCVLLVTGIVTLTFRVQPVRAQGTIYIRADGSIDPPTAPISTVDNITYTLTGNITADADGIVVERSNIIIDGNGYTVQGSGTLNSNGINLTGRSNVTIQDIEIKTGFDYSIHLINSYNNKIVGNKIANTFTYGQRIFLEYSSDNSIVGNVLTNNGMGIELYPSCSNNIISGNDIANNGYGMALVDSSSNSISGNNITNNSGYGIYFHTYSYPNSCIDNSISGNDIANNGGGIMFDDSSGNSISGNNITANGGNGFLTVTSGYGIYLYTGSNNSISGNNITANNGYGIALAPSSGNNIFHNNFVNNTKQVTLGSANIWDDGYPSGGNYWSDYNGTDLFRGPYQNETGSDGIGDTPYFIDSNNIDRYPLMNPWVPLPSASALVPLLNTFVTVMEPSTLGWDLGIGTPYVMYDAGLYKMWYWAFTNPGGFGRYAIAYAESNDGITWFNNQVVHDAGSGYYVTMSPWVLKEDGTYRMWHADYFETIDGDWSFYIAHMTSADGISWPAFMSAGDQEVLSAQGQTNPQGDGYDLFYACVIHESSGYVMWYSVNDHYAPGAPGPQKIWRATSTDGITWSNRQLSLPYIPDTWEGSVGHASVVKEDDGTYTMFYAAAIVGSSSIGIAQSSDGISWVNRTQLLKPSDLGANITGIYDPFCFTDVNGNRYLYFTYNDGESKIGRIQLGTLPTTHSLTITTTANGTTDPAPGTYLYSQGQTVPVQAVPDSGYVFDHWELDGVNTGSTNPTSVTMDADHTLNAVFVYGGLHDTTITNVASSKTVVGQGCSENVNVTAANQGDFGETFNVTAYANTTIIASQNVTLPAGDSTTLTFTWNATGFAYGNYTLSAYAWPVPGETDLANNNCTCSVPVHVGVPGDVSSSTPGVYDGVTNMKDIAYLVRQFNTNPSSPNWNPNADINGPTLGVPDGVVNMRDIALAILQFNQHE